jgi:hypothetical protein
VVSDPEEAGRRLFLPVKVNLARKPPGLGFRLKEAGSTVRVEWDDDPVEVDVEAVLGSSRAYQGPTKREEAAGIMREALSSGPMPAKEVIGRVEDTGISAETARRAAKDLGVVHDKAGFRSGWEWSLPPSARGVPVPDAVDAPLAPEAAPEDGQVYRE